MIKPFETIRDVRLNDMTVANAYGHNLSLEKIIIILANEKRDLVEQYLKLHALAPKKIMAKDGKIYVWHCPDDLIPIQVLE